MTSLDSFKCRKTLKVGTKSYVYYSLPTAEKNGLKGISRLPYSMKVLLENLLRNEDDRTVKKADIQAVAKWMRKKALEHEIAFRPARVLMQDFTGVPAVVDLAAMRNAMQALGGSPEKINPLVPVDLVIDHSVIVNFFGDNKAFKKNVEEEYKQNQERYEFLKWGQKAFSNFSVVPPGTGICHQVNLEYLSQVVWTEKATETKGKTSRRVELAYPDTLVGTDSHTTMVNGLGVLGWGVGGIEAEAAMLGQPQSMLLPEVVGFRLTGNMREGVTATDLVLRVTQMLRKKGVVNKFVEFYGEGLADLPLANRATIANMAPEYGATCGFFPVDETTIGFLKTTNRAAGAKVVEAYAKKQGLWRSKKSPEPVFTDTLSLDLGDVVPSLAGPKRPQDRVPLSQASQQFIANMEKEFERKDDGKRHKCDGADYDLGHGDIVLAAITSCTNTSNPYVMLGAGLIARNAAKLGLKAKPWVKTSLAPGSQVVTEYLAASGLLGCHVAGRAEDDPGHRHGWRRDRRRGGEVRADAASPGRPFECFRQPEIQDLHRAVLAHLDVRRLEVAVNDALLVCGFHRRRDLPCDQQRVVHGNWAARDPLRQVLAVDEFHHEGERAAGAFESVDGGDVGMVQRGERSRFALEACDPLRILGEPIGQHFDCDRSVQAGVDGAIDGAHAAFTNRCGDFVDAEATAGREGHWSQGLYAVTYWPTDRRFCTATSAEERPACTVTAPRSSCQRRCSWSQ